MRSKEKGRERLTCLSEFRAAGSGTIHPIISKEQFEEILEPPEVIFVLEYCRRANIFKMGIWGKGNTGIYWPVSLSLKPGQILKQLIY